MTPHVQAAHAHSLFRRRLSSAAFISNATRSPGERLTALCSAADTFYRQSNALSFTSLEAQ